MYVEVPVYYLKQWNEYLKSLRVSNTRLHKQYLLAVPILQDIVKNEYYSGYICVESTVYYIKQWNLPEKSDAFKHKDATNSICLPYTNHTK
jgi:hypothetical protein